MIVIRVLAHAVQEIGGAVWRRAPSELLAIDDGTKLDDPEFAGADLIVAHVEVVPHATDHAADATDDAPAVCWPPQREVARRLAVLVRSMGHPTRRAGDRQDRLAGVCRQLVVNRELRQGQRALVEAV